jgi:hypothetical protein
VFFALCCVFPSWGERELEAVHLGYLAWGISFIYGGFRVMEDIKPHGERKVTVHLKSDRCSSELLAQAFASVVAKAIVSSLPVLSDSETPVRNSFALQESSK